MRTVLAMGFVFMTAVDRAADLQLRHRHQPRRRTDPGDRNADLRRRRSRPPQPERQHRHTDGLGRLLDLENRRPPEAARPFARPSDGRANLEGLRSALPRRGTLAGKTAPAPAAIRARFPPALSAARQARPPRRPHRPRPRPDHLSRPALPPGRSPAAEAQETHAAMAQWAALDLVCSRFRSHYP